MVDDDGSPLEIVQLEMQLKFADLVSTSLETNILSAIEPDRGRLLFNERTEDHEPFQRVAAVRLLGSHVVLIFLSRDGHQVVVENARTSAHPAAARALAYEGGTDGGR